jgi:hypothetical protein
LQFAEFQRFALAVERAGKSFQRQALTIKIAGEPVAQGEFTGQAGLVRAQIKVQRQIGARSAGLPCGGINSIEFDMGAGNTLFSEGSERCVCLAANALFGARLQQNFVERAGGL